MHILHIASTLNIGGGESVIRDLSVNSVKRGHKVTVITFFISANNHIVDHMRQNDVEIILIPNPSFFSFYKAIKCLANHLQKSEYDVVHVHFRTTLWYVALAKIRLQKRLKLIRTEHSPIVAKDKVDRIGLVLLKPFVKKMYSQYNKVICVSHHVYHSVIRYAPKMQNKCELIYNGVDLKQLEFENIRSSDLKNDTFTIVTVAGLCPVKRLETCIYAVSQLKINVNWYIYGDGSSRKELSLLIKKFNLQDKVFLPGFKKNVLELIQKADLYVQPSASEGFCMALLEAMACGLPVIVSNVPSMLEVIGHAGLVFPVNEVAVLASLINSLTQDPYLRKELAQRSLERSQLFDLENTASHYETLYQKVNNFKIQ